MRAQRIIRIAMGKNKHGQWVYDEDPLAAWCGVAAIIDLVERAGHELPDT